MPPAVRWTGGRLDLPDQLVLIVKQIDMSILHAHIQQMIGDIGARFKERVGDGAVEFMLLKVHDRTAFIVEAAVVIKRPSVIVHFKNIGIAVVVHQIPIEISFADAVAGKLHGREAVSDI